MIAVLSWWLLSSLLGLVAFPLAWRIFSRLPDRGYGFSRALGILVAAFLLWMGASLGVFQNSMGGAVLSLLILVGIGIWAGSGHWNELRSWIRRNRRTIFVMEGIFIVAFLAWSFVRAGNPNIEATEKPMELAFINAILRSRTFPPNDPWLSGYAISYYYFGYIHLALLARLTAVSTAVAFNLGNSLWFAMSILGTYSLLFNLLTRRDGRPRLAASMLGPIFVMITGNLEGFLEVLHARHVFWRAGPDGNLVSGFWKWLDIKTLVEPPMTDPAWIPTRHWWWWRASRVVNDVDLAGKHPEVIDEFPFFSFLLADNHPHVLALPFVLMALTFSFQVFTGGKREDLHLGNLALSDKIRKLGISVGLLLLLFFAGSKALDASAEGQVFSTVLVEVGKAVILGAIVLGALAVLLLLLTGAIPSTLTKKEFWFGAWLFGALAFLNTWDFPIYLSVLLVVMWWSVRDEPGVESWKRVLFTTLSLAFAGVLLYLPWYPGFSSQAGGILPNLIFPTKLRQFLVMFGTSFIPIAVWLVLKARQGWNSRDMRALVGVAIIIPLSLVLISLALGFAVNSVLLSQDPAEQEAAIAGLGASSFQEVLNVALRRLAIGWTPLILGGLIAAGGILIRRSLKVTEETKKRRDQPWPFIVMLIAVGALLIMGPEFLYLKDLFLNRMNTVFKFYYAAWIMWGIATAYVVTELWPRRWSFKGFLQALVVIPLILGLFYPIMSIWTKTNGFNPALGFTLDGTEFYDQLWPEDYAAMGWINEHLDEGIIAEAVGGSYTQYGRISAHTGLPTVLGWDFHEIQWRGTAEEQGSREQDIRALYQTAHWSEAKSVLDAYAIDYVYVGPLEHIAYDLVNETKFEVYMDMIYQNDNVRIYARRGEASE
jgi:uncharacterized membrane protein